MFHGTNLTLSFVEDSIFCDGKELFFLHRIHLSISQMLANVLRDLMTPYCFIKHSTLGKVRSDVCWGTLGGRSRWKFCDRVFVQRRDFFFKPIRNQLIRNTCTYIDEYDCLK